MHRREERDTGRRESSTVVAGVGGAGREGVRKGRDREAGP